MTAPRLLTAATKTKETATLGARATSTLWVRAGEWGSRGNADEGDNSEERELHVVGVRVGWERCDEEVDVRERPHPPLYVAVT